MNVIRWIGGLGLALLLTVAPLSVNGQTTFRETGQIGGRGQITDMAWSPAGDVLAVASDAGIWLYDARLDDVRHLEPTAPEPTGITTVGAVAWNSSGTLIAGGNGLHRQLSTFSSTAHIWDVASGEVVHAFPLDDGVLIRSLFWSDDDLHALATPDDNTTLIWFTWDAASGDLIEQRDITTADLADSNRVERVVWGETTVTLLMRRADSPITVVFDLKTGDLASADPTTTAVTSPDGSFTADIVERQQIIVRDADGVEQHTFALDTQTPFLRWADVVWQSGGSALAGFVRTREPALHVWDGPSGELLLRVTEPAVSSIDRVIFVPGREQIIYTTFLGEIKLWDYETGDLVAQRWAHQFNVISAVYSPDGAQMATVSAVEAAVRIWDTTTGRGVTLLRADMNPFYAVAWRPDGSTIVAAEQIAEDGAPLRLARWDALTGAPLDPFRIDEDDNALADFVLNLVYSPDSTMLAAATVSNQTGRGKIRVFDTATGDIIFRRDTFSITQLAWSADSTRLAFNDVPDPTAQVENFVLLDMTDSTAVIDMTLSETGDIVRALDWRPRDGRQQVAVLRDGRVQIWDVSESLPRELSAIDTGAGRGSVAWSPDGDLLALTAGGRSPAFTIDIYRVSDNGRQLEPVDTLAGAFALPTLTNQLIWSPAGDQLAGVESLGVVRLWGVD